jgi:hypothetical protein
MNGEIFEPSSPKAPDTYDELFANCKWLKARYTTNH